MARTSFFTTLHFGGKGFNGVVQKISHVTALFADNLADRFVAQTLLQT